MSRVIHVQSSEELDRHLKDSRVLVDFSAEWFPKYFIFEFKGPCRFITPTVEKLSSEFTTFTFLHVDIDKLNTHPIVKTIRSVPTFHVYINGTKVQEFSGADEKAIRAALENNK
ncbi:hypothetical protein ACTFIU_011586 [Dictyostelium citrinum]